MYSEMPAGSLNAFSYLEVTDIYGNKRMRRVSHGRAWNVSFDTAQDMVKLVRTAENDSNPGGKQIHAEFKVHL